MSVGLTTNYFSTGSGAPSSAPSVASGEWALYVDTRTGTLWFWNLHGTPAWTQITTGGGGGGSGLYSAYINIQDQKSQNTAGGTFTSGAWQTRTLNTKQSDAGSNATLSSNQITLVAGTYDCLISCPAQYVNSHQARLQNVTDGTTVLTGTTEGSPATGSNMAASRSIISGEFTIAASKALEVQHQCQTTKATDGFGQAANFTTEVYTVAIFWKH